MTDSTATVINTNDVPPAAPAPVTELDIVFCCDCTGSMSAYIKSAQDNIRSISQSIHDNAKNVNVRYGLVKYRDHPPQDSTFITEVFPFTKKIDTMKTNIDTMVSAALHEVSIMEWRENAVKICVLIADAPPHGLGEDGDGFPEGCPLGTDPIETCKTLAAKGVAVYAVGVEPVLSSSYKYARDFMMMVAKVTEGKFLPLGRAEILSQVIVSGALEGVNMADTWATLEREVEAEAAKKGEKLTAEEAVARVEKCMLEKPVQCAQVDVANPYMDHRYNYSNVDHMFQAGNLKAAKPMMQSQLNSHVQSEVASYAWSAQPAQCQSAQMSAEQCTRAKSKAMHKMGLF